MESWSYVFESKGLHFANESDLQIDGLDDKECISNVEQVNMEIDFPFMFSGEFGIGADSHSKGLVSNCGKSLSPGSILSSSLVESKGQVFPSEEGGCVTEFENTKSDKVQLERPRPVVSSRKRVQFCVVSGCNMDLSSSKDYYKRHKVCEVHSKTAKVVVNGVEKRFCQQCSRFHLLSEFDGTKRSCRKRLVNHNERRRRPQLRNFSGSKTIKSGSWISLSPTRRNPGSTAASSGFSSTVVSHSSCAAPSLLSAKSPESLTQFSEIPNTMSLNNPDGLTLHKFTPLEVDEFFRGPDYLNGPNRFSTVSCSTVDMFLTSSQFERAKQCRNSDQV